MTLSVGDTVRLNGDTGTIIEVWPGGSDVRITWEPGQSAVAGRTLWCSASYLTTEGDETCEENFVPPATEKVIALPVMESDLILTETQNAQPVTEPEIAPSVTEPAKPQTRSRPIASRDRAMRQATFL